MELTILLPSKKSTTVALSKGATAKSVTEGLITNKENHLRAGDYYLFDPWSADHKWFSKDAVLDSPAQVRRVHFLSNNFRFFIW